MDAAKEKQNTKILQHRGAASTLIRDSVSNYEKPNDFLIDSKINYRKNYSKNISKLKYLINLIQ